MTVDNVKDLVLTSYFISFEQRTKAEFLPSRWQLTSKDVHTFPRQYLLCLSEKSDSIVKVWALLCTGFSAVQQASMNCKCWLPWQCHRLPVGREKRSSKRAGKRKWKRKIMMEQDMSSHHTSEAEIHFGGLVTARVPKPVCGKVAVLKQQTGTKVDHTKQSWHKSYLLPPHHCYKNHTNPFYQSFKAKCAQVS